MSTKLKSYVWDACASSGIKGTKLIIMVFLAFYSKDDGISDHSIKNISRQTAAGKSAISKALTELGSEGWLYREKRRDGNRNASTRYYLNVEMLEDIALRYRGLTSN